VIRYLRLSARTLLRDRGFTLTATLTLALGSGIATAVFTAAQVLLVRDLPVRQQDRIVALWGETPDGTFTNYPLTHAQAREFARGTRTLQRTGHFAYHGAWPAAIRQGDGVSRLRQALVSGEFFDVLGVRPLIGRSLIEDDDRVGARPVAVISHGAWRRLFGGRHDAVGEHIVVHGTGVSHEVVGVMPEGLDIPRGTEFWVPVVPATANPDTGASTAFVHVIGRLASGASAATAREELTSYFRRPESPVSIRTLRGAVMPLPDLLLGDTRPAMIAFVIASVMLLLIACFNVANLLLVRGLSRSGEFAIQLALGVGRTRLIAQLLTEHAVVAVVGGAAGVLVATVVLKLFTTFAPGSVPRLGEIQLDTTAWLGACGITGIAFLAFGLAPAVVASRVEFANVLRVLRGQAASRGSRRATEVLVVGQIALAVLMLSAAVLLVRSLVNLERADLAMDPSRVLIGELAFRYDRLDDATEQRALLDRLLPAVRAVPGVAAVSPVVATPYAGTAGFDGRAASEEQTQEDAARNPIFNIEVVVPEYFATFGISAERGRLFTAVDVEGATPVVVVSETAARHLFPNGDPVGKRVRIGGTPGISFAVIGIVRDTRYRELRTLRPTIYFSLRQSVFPVAPVTLAIRTVSEPAAIVPSLRHAISEVDPDLKLASAAPFDDYLDRPMEQPRLNALLLAVFASTAMALALIGQFGVMATMVRQRTRELGVRSALGATSRDLLRLVLGRGLLLAVTGTAIGLAGAIVANRLLAALLFDISPTDPLTLLGVGSLFVGVAILTTGIPARWTARIDPVRALRAD
jgi:putative ABC transport system permease protein